MVDTQSFDIKKLFYWSVPWISVWGSTAVSSCVWSMPPKYERNTTIRKVAADSSPPLTVLSSCPLSGPASCNLGVGILMDGYRWKSVQLLPPVFHSPLGGVGPNWLEGEPSSLWIPKVIEAVALSLPIFSPLSGIHVNSDQVDRSKVPCSNIT